MTWGYPFLWLLLIGRRWYCVWFLNDGHNDGILGKSSSIDGWMLGNFRGNKHLNPARRWLDHQCLESRVAGSLWFSLCPQFWDVAWILSAWHWWFWLDLVGGDGLTMVWLSNWQVRAMTTCIYVRMCIKKLWIRMCSQLWVHQRIKSCSQCDV